MSRIAADVTWLVGRTPLVQLEQLSPRGGARLVAKLEAQNPTSSNKDRAVLGMIAAAERDGILRSGGTLVECSGGDLGIALAMVGRRRGYRVVLTMPECLAAGHCSLLRALGAEIVLTPSELGMRGAMERAEQLTAEDPEAICLQAFTNRANARTHADTTAREIWEDTDGRVAAVVVPVGTGGTAAGCAAFFRERHLGVRVIAVEPAGSPVLSGGVPGPHQIPGLGAGFVPDILTLAHLDEVLTVDDGDAVAGVRDLARHEGILAGPASGAVIHAACRVAARPECPGSTIVAVLPDSGERFVDHPAYDHLDCEGTTA